MASKHEKEEKYEFKPTSVWITTTDMQEREHDHAIVVQLRCMEISIKHSHHFHRTTCACRDVGSLKQLSLANNTLLLPGTQKDF